MMERYLLDTNIFTFMATNDYDSLTRDVKEILDNYENKLLMSIESVRELIVAHRAGKTAHAMTLKVPLISSDHKFPFYMKQGLDLIYNKK